MLEIITDILYSKANGYFERLIPLVEKVHADDKSFPKEYIGNGNYKAIDVDHFAGLGYFRQTSDVTISDLENRGRPMDDLKRYQYNIRLVGCVKKNVIGSDNAYASDMLGVLLAKQLQETNGSIRSLLGARNVSISARSIKTDHKDILSDEFTGILGKGIPLTYSLIAIDIEISIEITTDCINTICGSYTSGQTSVIVVNNGGVRAAVLRIIPDVNSYIVPELYGKTVTTFQVQNFTGANTDCSLSGNLFTIINTECDVSESYPLIIYYK